MADSINIGTGLSWRTCAYASLAALLVGIGLGAWGMHTWQVSGLRQELAVMAAKLKHAEEKPPVVKETVKTVTDTQIAYVPKETVVYRDPVTGQASERQLDGKMTFAKPEFIFTVNGKPGKFTKTDDERFVFDKNMMQLNQTSTIRVEAEIPTVDKTKRNAIGPIVTTESWGLIASRETERHRLLLMGGKKWDDKNGRGYEAGGAWQVKF